MELLFTWEALASFLTLTFLEIVLGVDNIVFIAILASKLPEHQRAKARQIGLAVALITRLLLLFSLYWIAHLEKPMASFALTDGTEIEISWRQVILGLGGLYLLYKAVVEMNETIRVHTRKEREAAYGGPRQMFFLIIVQIAVIDIVFSLDSVITAVGIADHVEIMAAAIVIAVLVMLFLINPISDFIDRHKEVKIVALSFLLLVGFILVAEAGNVHVPKGYLYFALGFATLIQILVLWSHSSEAKAALGKTHHDADGHDGQTAQMAAVEPQNAGLSDQPPRTQSH